MKLGEKMPATMTCIDHSTAAIMGGMATIQQPQVQSNAGLAKELIDLTKAMKNLVEKVSGPPVINVRQPDITLPELCPSFAVSPTPVTVEAPKVVNNIEVVPSAVDLKPNMTVNVDLKPVIVALYVLTVAAMFSAAGIAIAIHFMKG